MKQRGLLAQRETKFAPVDVQDIKLDGRFSGYASVFGAVRMLFQHDPDEPIGCWSKIVEDEKGLYVEGKIIRGVRRSEEVLELMREGALDGLSIGFKTKRARVNPTTKIRTILAADLWEISVVTFPLLEEARIETSNGFNALHSQRDATVDHPLADTIRRATKLMSQRI